MIKKIRALVEKHWDMVSYLFFGVLTTIVFKSHDWSMQTVLPELGKFVGCRAASGGLETVLILLTVDILGWNGNIWKLIISVLVVILNYVSSKLLVFRK